MAVQLEERRPLEYQATNVPLRVAAVALAVRAIDRMSVFYRDVIGLAVLHRETGIVTLGAGDVALLHLLHRPDALPDDPAGAGLFHTAFLLPTRADLGSWLRHAQASGVRLEGAADHLVSEAVYLSDPEGNGIEVYADRPAAEWRWSGQAASRQVEMANRPLDFPGILAAATPWAGAPAGTQVGHIHLRVGDVARAMAFYVSVLGLDVIRNMPEAAFLSTGGYHHHVGVNVWRSLSARPRDPARAGLAWFAMEAADESVAAAIGRRGGAADLATTGLRDPWGTQIKITIAEGAQSNE